MTDPQAMVSGDLYRSSLVVAGDLQAEVDRLTKELADATARADALDIRCSAAERVAVAADNAARNTNWNHASLPLTADLTTALDLWRRVETEDHPTRARDYGDAITQLAEARKWVPDFDENYRRTVQANADHWGQTVSEWLADSIAQYLLEYGVR